MSSEDRERMIELCRRIHRETNPRKLTLWIDDLNALIQRKIEDLRSKSPSSSRRATLKN